MKYMYSITLLVKFWALIKPSKLDIKGSGKNSYQYQFMIIIQILTFFIRIIIVWILISLINFLKKDGFRFVIVTYTQGPVFFSSGTDSTVRGYGGSKIFFSDPIFFLPLGHNKEEGEAE